MTPCALALFSVVLWESTSIKRLLHAETREIAARLREALERGFHVIMGRWRDEPVGPHPQSMYQVKFGPDEFARVVPWLMLNRRGLNILVHPETGNAYQDHAENALWLGQKLSLRLDTLR